MKGLISMKKIFTAILLFLTIITITGCKRIIILKDDAPTITNSKKIGSYAKNTNLNFDSAKFKTKLNETMDKIIDAKEYYDIEEALYSILNNVTELMRKYSVANCLTNYDPENSEYIDKYNVLHDAYYDYEEFYNNMIVEIGKMMNS